MKKSRLALLSMILAAATLIGSLAGCNDSSSAQAEETSSIRTELPSETESVTIEGTEPDSEQTVITDTDSIGITETETETKKETESETYVQTETEEIIVTPKLEGENALLIENADTLKNGVNAYFTDPDRKNFTYSNLKMQMEYGLSADQAQLVKYLANKKGNNYVTNTMDVFVRMKDGETYYASQSSIPTAANIYRLGFYFYEVRLEDQVFANEVEIIEEKKVSHTKPNYANQCTAKAKDGILHVKNLETASDPYVRFGSNYTFSADKYQLLQIRMKADLSVTGADLFLVAGSQSSFNAQQSIKVPIIADNEYHDYFIPLFSAPDYTGTLKGLRLDVNGAGAKYEVEYVKLLAADFGNTPRDLSVRRSFNVYSDKMHQIIQVAAAATVENIAEIGMLTEIDADTVAKLIVKDSKGTHDTLDGVDWSTVEYIGFDIKKAGIFGYILPFDGKGGALKVTLTDNKYIIEQTATPEGNKIVPSVKGTNNANDFYMGQRIYTDSTHNFDKFLHEAYCERNPLKDTFITIDKESSSGASYLGYDSLNGIYRFESVYPSGGFDNSYYNEPNKHYRVSFEIKGDSVDRNIYVMSYTKGGNLETAVLLDKNDVMLPMPLEVGKNYSEEGGERNIYNLDDATYGQVIFPLVVEAKSNNNNYTLLNLYQRWGNYPLKQLSFIQFVAPYFFMSTGVTETNCILPWYHMQNAKGLNTLPDYRTMSAPFWSTQPQHNSCGVHHWLIYTDEIGKTITSESTKNTIDSFGPIYADLHMDHISDDGRIKVSYVHTEMPQIDENRVYYEMSYEVLEDISFKDFSKEFQFYSVSSNVSGGKYTRVGYLNEENESVVVKANTENKLVEYTLGKNCPYFSYFDMDDYSKSTQQGGYANVAFLVYNSSFVIGGEKADPNFAIVDKNGKISVTLALDEVTLKAGDTFTINAILLPWGSQELESVWETHLDKNVRDVRENSLLNPLKATSIADCEIIDSVFVPKIKSTNGTSAEFTVSGGNNHCAVRVYGFEKMTVPVIYEKIDGEWKEYIVNSSKNPDSQNYTHYYDGYGYHYDGDGTFSYSFIVEMDEGKERTFKIVADGNYKKWERETNKSNSSSEFVIDPASGYTASDLYYAGKIDAFCGVSRLAQNFNSVDGLVTVNYNGNTIAASDVNNCVSHNGPYLVLSGWTMVQGGISKYVWSADGGKTWNDIEMFGRTIDKGSSAMIDGAINRVKNAFTFTENDTKNVSYQGADALAPKGIAANLEKYAGRTIDIVFAAIPAKDEKTLCPFICVKNVTVKAAENDEEQTEEQEPETVYNEYVKEGSGYSVAPFNYASCLDMINGRGPDGSSKYTQRGGNSTKGVDVINHNGNTLSGSKLIVTGWSVVDGGISKYVWSVDGGKTWHDAIPFNGDVNAASQAHLDGVRSRIGITLGMDSAAMAVYQGSVNLPDPSTVKGLEVDLSEYVGQTVEIIFAAVSARNTNTLCVLHCIKGVKVIN